MRYALWIGVGVSCLMVYCGLAIAQDSALDTARANWLVDDFEDQNLDGWTVPTGPCTAAIVPGGAAGSAHSLNVNGACGHDGGTSYELGPIEATSVGLYVKNFGILNNHMYVVLDDDDQAANGYIITFVATSDGRLKALVGSVLPFDLVPNDSIDWRQLQFTIDWVGKNVDLSIDGVPRQYNMPFATSTISHLGWIHLYNVDAANALYDQIELSTPPPSLGIMFDGFESADESGWTTAVPSLPSRLVLFSAGGISGAVGGRSGADVLCGQAAEGRTGVPVHATTRAFLSVELMDTIANMPTNYGVPTQRKVTGPNRIVIADRWDDLMDGTVDTALEDAGVMSPGNWYSGSAADGSLDPDTCSGWTDGAGSAGRYGYSASTSSTWISAGDSVCGMSLVDILCLAWR